MAIEGVTYTARGAAGTVSTQLGLSTIVHVSRQSRIISQGMHNSSICACAVTARIVVCLAILASAYRIDLPPFLILVTTLLNDGTIMNRPRPTLDVAQFLGLG